MEFLRSRAGDHTDLASGGTAIFGGIVGSENLHFLHGIQIGCADGGTVGTSADADRAIKGDERILRTAAVHGETAGGEAEAEPGKGPAADARLEEGEEERIAAIQREVLNLLLFDRLADDRGFGIDLRRAGFNVDDFGQLADREFEVDRQREPGIELVA